MSCCWLLLHHARKQDHCSFKLKLSRARLVMFLHYDHHMYEVLKLRRTTPWSAAVHLNQKRTKAQQQHPQLGLEMVTTGCTCKQVVRSFAYVVYLRHGADL